MIRSPLDFTWKGIEGSVWLISSIYCEQGASAGAVRTKSIKNKIREIKKQCVCLHFLPADPKPGKTDGFYREELCSEWKKKKKHTCAVSGLSINLMTLL